eukprot:970537-Rhodomonas_salina.2
MRPLVTAILVLFAFQLFSGNTVSSLPLKLCSSSEHSESRLPTVPQVLNAHCFISGCHLNCSCDEGFFVQQYDDETFKCVGRHAALHADQAGTSHKPMSQFAGLLIWILGASAILLGAIFLCRKVSRANHNDGAGGEAAAQNTVLAHPVDDSHSSQTQILEGSPAAEEGLQPGTHDGETVPSAVRAEC